MKENTFFFPFTILVHFEPLFKLPWKHLSRDMEARSEIGAASSDFLHFLCPFCQARANVYLLLLSACYESAAKGGQI